MRDGGGWSFLGTYNVLCVCVCADRVAVPPTCTAHTEEGKLGAASTTYYYYYRYYTNGKKSSRPTLSRRLGHRPRAVRTGGRENNIPV